MKHGQLLFLITLLFHGPVFAANSVLSGEFDGSEPLAPGLPGTCNGATYLRYQAVGPIQVSSDGAYSVVDAFNFNGVDVNANLYQGIFNPGDPLANLVTSTGIEIAEKVSLSSGTDYTLVIQPWCSNREGAWAVTFSGPGDVVSNANVAVPEFTSGIFGGGGNTLNSACGNGEFQQSGPLQFSTAGAFYYTDISMHFDVDVCLLIYSTAVDPANPGANLVASLDDFGSADLEAGKDYYMVVQSSSVPDTGEFFYVLAPPASFRIQHAMSGSWYFPPTSGQGFFMDVYENINQVAVGWYTYDLERPAGDVTAMMGDPGHRWMTAQGPYSGNTAELDIYWTAGMIFDSNVPPKNDSVKDGTMVVEFEDCFRGSVSYEIESVSAMGEIPIQRIANDAAALCTSLTEGPGKPGPL